MQELVNHFLPALLNKRAESSDAYRAFLSGLEVQLERGLEEFAGLYATRAVLYPHQVAVAHKVLTQCPRGAILADEVGLGKTIEAGLILKELGLRGQAQRVLIATPAHLLEQWQGELLDKFDLESVVLSGEELRLRRSRKETLWGDGITLVSLGLLPRLQGTELEELQKVRWDLVGVDEAHRLRGRSNKTHAVVKSLRRKRTLLLTATPVQTGLSDLLALLELIDPYLLSPLETTGLSEKEPDVSLLETLKSRLQTVMIRNRRSDVALVGLHLPERSAQTLRFVLPPAEAALRQTVQTYTREIYQRQNRRGSFDLIALERRLASHPRSLEQGLRLRLERLSGKGPQAQNTEGDEEDGLPSSQTQARDRQTLQTLIYEVSSIVEAEKARQLLEFLEGLFKSHPGEQVIVFSEFLDTLDALEALLSGEQIATFRFDGRSNPMERRETVARFWAEGQVLLLSEAGAEGQNLQRAHILVNFDLPWNPMRLEQRIGRVHRIGQTRPVQVYNLVAVGTIEERLVDILLGRINLFEGIIGELDAIMGVLEGTGWEAQVLELSLLEGGEAAQLSAVREADIERVSAQFQLAGELDPRSLERFDLSLRDRYLELKARQQEGLDHLPLRRYLRHAARALSLDLDADAELMGAEGQPPLTLSPRLAADGEAELLHPMHPFVKGLLERTQLEAPISRLNIEVSSSALIYPEALLNKRGLMLSLKVCWEGDAQDQILVHLFVDTLGRVHTDLGELYERSPWSEGHTLLWPGQSDLESAVQTALESLPVALQTPQRKLEREARGRFETVARTLEHYFAEQMEGVERDLKFKLQQAINARIALHHAQDPDLRDLERAKLGTLERERDRVLRDTPDRLAALSSERDRKVNAERTRLKLERTVALVGVAVVQWV